MDDLVRDILGYMKAAQGELPMQRVDVGKLIREITATYPGLHPSCADITIGDGLTSVWANESALAQIISNLLGNAVKFVPRGVRPRVAVRGEEIDGVVRLWFEDNGIGITKNSQARLFNLFTRLNRPEDYEGTGIGLAIVRKAVTRMGGSVGVESDEGKGSRFWVQLKKAGE